MPTQQVLPRKRTNASKESLATKVARLQRQVNANKPEIRQESYTITVQADPVSITPIPLIDPSVIVGDEFKLHRIHCAWRAPAQPELGNDLTYGIMYSPKEGYTEADIPVPSSSAGDLNDNYLTIFNATKQRVWQRRLAQSYFNYSPDVATASGPALAMEMDYKWTIPMTCGTATATVANPTILHNQVYLMPGNIRGATGQGSLYVTIWYTDN